MVSHQQRPDQDAMFPLREWKEAVEATVDAVTGELRSGLSEALTGPAAKVSQAQWRPMRSRAEAFVEDLFAHATWRRLATSSWDDFERRFLLGHAMGLRVATGDGQPGELLDYWAETLVHLMFQRRLHDSDEQLDRALSAMIGLIERGEVDEALVEDARPFWASCIEATNRVPRLAGRGEAFLWARIEVWLWAWYLVAASVRGRDACGRRLREAFAELDTLLGGLDDEAAPAGVADATRRGHSVRIDRPLVDAEGPLPDAFLWLREVLDGVSEFIFDEMDPDDCVLARDERFAIAASRPLDGVWADPLGGLFVGGEARRRYMQVRAATMDSLLAIANQVLGARMLRRFERRRRFYRHEEEHDVLLEAERERAMSRSRDHSPLGVRVVVPPGWVDRFRAWRDGARSCVRIRARDGWRHSRVVWVQDVPNDGVHEAGLELRGPDGESLDAELTMNWLAPARLLQDESNALSPTAGTRT